eukprot:gene16180-20487_t
MDIGALTAGGLARPFLIAGPCVIESEVLCLTVATHLAGIAARLNLPVLFNGSVTSTATDVYVDITRATPAQLGLTTAQTAAYTAILNDAAANTNGY